ncbi:AraC family transcriptional regulator [Bacillus horti]|uniref:AraC-like DNA-binding protein n=1 Tax=Caldalkalibacillus horti TaxID=77523 RepID=A0ABT9VV31_9BACI|nr:AraC family transcriptional regulator [Bacillus horti]MDQ0164735.1 AraC-like DNA-binding protein [Bacillus horti]
MEPVRKTFDSEHEFPFFLAYKDTKTPNHELPDHLHDWYEIVYVYQGKGTFFIDQQLFQAEQGDIIIIPGNTIHRAVPAAENLITSTAIFFSPVLLQRSVFWDWASFLRLFHEARVKKNYRYHLDERDCVQLEDYLDQLRDEQQKEKVDQKQAIALLLQLVLVFLNRHCLNKEMTVRGSTAIGPTWINETLDYIEQRLEGELELTELAKQAAVSTAHFSRVFKELIGMNVTEYITTKRMIRAKNLLATTQENIALIAEKCGYNSMPHFYRTFKRMTGRTPSEYRNSSEH